MKINRSGRWLRSWVLLVMVVVSGSPSADVNQTRGTVQTPPPVSLAFDVQPIFDTWCVQCHLLESPQAGLVLENGEAWANLVGVDSTQAPLARVRPGDPKASYLLYKLHGTQATVGGSGQAMPYDGRGLPAEAIDRIERWIAEGAADN